MTRDLKNEVVAVLGAGAVGRSLAADCKLAGNTVRLYDLPEFAKESLKDLDKSGIEVEGFEWNKYNFRRSGIAHFDLVTDNLEKALDGAKYVIVAVPSIGHDAFFKKLAPVLKDGQIVHILPDNFGSLKLRKELRRIQSDVRVIIGGWSSTPYGTRIVKQAGIDSKRVFFRYRAISLRGAALPKADQEEFLESSQSLGCFDSVTFGDGAASGDTVLDIGFSNVNPTLHCPGSILGAAVIENYGRVFGGNDKSDFSIYSHVYTESVSEVQYAFYQEEEQLAQKIGVEMQHYPKETFFSRSNILGPEYMGDGSFSSFDEQFEMAFGTGPFDIQNRYVTEDIPVACHIYHELGKKFGIETPVIDSIITLGSAMLQRNFYEEGVTLDDLGIGQLNHDQLLDYLTIGTYPEEDQQEVSAWWIESASDICGCAA